MSLRRGVYTFRLCILTGAELLWSSLSVTWKFLCWLDFVGLGCQTICVHISTYVSLFVQQGTGADVC